MDAERLTQALCARLRDRRLLDHPFYRRWTAGEVSIDELRDYAAQYRHFEAMLPQHLGAVAAAAGHPALRDQALRNLADEAPATAPTHLQLFDDFAAALGAPQHAEPSPAMAHLLATYAQASAQSAPAGFAALLAYESQASEVSASKAQGLREHGILDGEALRFWDLHASLDSDHAAWAVDALVRSGADSEVVLDAATEAAGAWWDFLDEREALPA